MFCLSPTAAPFSNGIRSIHTFVLPLSPPSLFHSFIHGALTLAHNLLHFTILLLVSHACNKNPKRNCSTLAKGMARHMKWWKDSRLSFPFTRHIDTQPYYQTRSENNRGEMRCENYNMAFVSLLYHHFSGAIVLHISLTQKSTF